MKEHRAKRGQGLVEFAIMLPILLLLLIGLAELGFALRNYLVVVNADREGCRFAARGRFSDERVIERVISAGGVVRRGGLDVPFMSIYVPASLQETGGSKELADELIDMVEGIVVQHPDKFTVVSSVEQARRSHAEGKIGLALGMENGSPVEGDLANLQGSGTWIETGDYHVDYTGEIQFAP